MAKKENDEFTIVFNEWLEKEEKMKSLRDVLLHFFEEGYDAGVAASDKKYMS